MRDLNLTSEYENCLICPRKCGVNRINGERGYCGTGPDPVVNIHMLHQGEEPPITGVRGSGAVFFEGCNLKCIFCQNFDISRGPTSKGTSYTPEELSDLYLDLESQGAHNINLVTSGHFIPSIRESLKTAKRNGLKIPVVYNSGGYESVDSLRTLEGLIDIYMPDMKFFSPELSSRLAGAPDYFEVCSKALDEMFRQTGPSVIGDDGIMRKGMIVRHLMLPGKLFDTKKILDYLCGKFGNDIYISLMNQYTPLEYKYKDMHLPDFLKRKLPHGHYAAAADYLSLLDQTNAFVQEGDASGDELLPNFKN